MILLSRYSRHLPLLSALLTAALVLGVVQLVDRAESERHLQAHRAEVLNQLSVVRARLENALSIRISLTRGLVAFVASHPSGTAAEFQSFASALFRQQAGIRSLQLAKDSIVSQVYPLEGNRQALGLKLLEVPAQREAVRRAIESHGTVVAGPVHLVQGGTGFISRTPIFLPDGDGKLRYWGLATVVIDQDALLAEAGLDLKSPLYRFALRGVDGQGASGPMFWGDEGVFGARPVTVDVVLPNGSWQMAAVPREGWTVPTSSPWLRGGGSLLALVSGLLVGFLARNPARLRERVLQTTQALRESEEKYRDLVQQAESLILRLDGQGNILFVNDYAQRFLGYWEDELLGRNVVGTILPAVDSAGRDMVAMLEAMLQDPSSHSRHEHENMRKDGERVWLAWNTRFFFDPQGRLVGLLCVGNDISERKRAEAILQEANDELEARVRVRTAELVRANEILQRENGARTEAQRALEEQNALYHALLKAQSDVGEGVILIEDGRVVFANDAVCHMSGYSEAEIAALPSFLEMACEEDRPLLLENYRRRLGGEQFGSRYEVGLLTKGGLRLEIEIAVAPLSMRDKVRIVVVVVDITARKRTEEELRRIRAGLEVRVWERTQELAVIIDELNTEIAERKKAEDALRESEARKAALLSAMPDLMFLQDRNFVYLDFHAADPRNLLVPPEAFLGRRMQEVLPQELTAAFSAKFHEARRSGKMQAVEYELATGGFTRCYEGRIVVCEGDRFLTIIRDITERRLAEETLKRQAQIINQIHESVIATDLEGHVSFWNKSAERMFGYSMDEALGRPISDFYPDQDYPSMLPEILRHLDTHGVYETEARRRRKGGEIIHIHLVLSLLRDREGFPSGLVGYSLDITERKRLEREIIDVSEEEQKRIGQELHDGLGQHLTGIAFLSKVLEQKLSAQGLPEARDALEIVGFVNQAVSKTRSLARGLFPVELEANGLMSALDQLVSNIGALFGIQCEFRCRAPVLVYDNIVAVNLYRIAQEAMNNAVKHSRATHIVVELAGEEERVRLSVIDDGMGFDRSSCGKGMGLHIMEYRARLIGARLEICPHPEGGTVVSVS